MRHLADQNIAPRTVALLRSAGYDTQRVSEIASAHTPDPLILDLAHAEGCVVIPQDLDFSALLAASGATTPSVVSVRLQNNRPEQVAATLQRVLPSIEADLQAGAIVAVEDA